MKKEEQIKEELRSSILKKIDVLREKIVMCAGSQKSDYLQVLIMVNDELDDVLLNWESESLSAISFDDDDDY